MSKVFLVTGGNAGIGLELVKLLATGDNIVYLAARNEKSGKEEAEKARTEGFKGVKFIHLDVTDPKTITAARDTIEKAEGHIDVLVNNAGISEMGKPQNATTVEIEPVRAAIETNLYGLIQTCTTLLPLIRKSPNPKTAAIVNVSTDMASNAHQARPGAALHVVAYNTSKAAANSYTIALAAELKGQVKVNCVTPGFTTTKLNHHAPGGKTPKQGAETILPWCVLGEDGPTGKFFGPDGKEFPW